HEINTDFIAHHHRISGTTYHSCGNSFQNFKTFFTM
ncbi:hypothetical protein DYADSP32_2078, partial [Dyadobacter sp. 32]